jgi:flagellar biogenesis protein FliO
MRCWRSVGMMALLVTSLTAGTLLADPNAAPPDRSWLRQSVQRAPNGPAPTQLSLGKWAAVLLLVGLSGFALWKRKSARGPGRFPVASQIQIGTVAKISPKAQLIVASVNGRSMLLGVTEANVTRLMWLDGSNDEQDQDDDSLAEEPVTADLGGPSSGNPYPNRVRLRRTPNAIANSPVGSAARSYRQTSRFREILADAIGIAPKAAQKSTAPRAPVDELVDGNGDRFVGRSPRQMNTPRMGPKAPPFGPLVDVEGQAAGLVARLNRSAP